MPNGLPERCAHLNARPAASLAPCAFAPSGVRADLMGESQSAVARAFFHRSSREALCVCCVRGPRISWGLVCARPPQQVPASRAITLHSIAVRGDSVCAGVLPACSVPFRGFSDWRSTRARKHEVENCRNKQFFGVQWCALLSGVGKSRPLHPAPARSAGSTHLTHQSIGHWAITSATVVSQGCDPVTLTLLDSGPRCKTSDAGLVDKPQRGCQVLPLRERVEILALMRKETKSCAEIAKIAGKGVFCP